MRHIHSCLALIALWSFQFAYAAEFDVNKSLPLAEVQKFVTGSTLINKPDKPGNTSKYIYTDEKWTTMPLVTIHVKPSADPAKDLKVAVDSAAKWMGLKSKPITGVGDEAFHEEQMNTVYFRKGKHVVIVGAAKDTATIKVKLIDLCKTLAQKL